jgi:toxin ParE1/3/4
VSYRLSDRAEADLGEIWDYSAEKWGVDQADRYIDALMSRFRWLSGNAALWQPRSDLTEGLYSYPQQSHLIYFRICRDEEDVIEIARVLHGRMEPTRHVL